MPRKRQVYVYRINIAANPHPDGVYERLLTRAASIIVPVRGSDGGKITKPRSSDNRPHLMRGRILVWTEIDVKGRWIDLEKEDDLSAELKQSISIPERARPNFRSFDYVFDTRSHVLYFEGKNDLDQTISPKNVHTILSRALSAEALGDGWPEVAVTIVPEVGVVEKILQIPHLHTIFIRVVKPNPDSASPEATERVFAKLEELNAYRLETTIKKASDADHITINDEYREMAEVASDNGLVVGKGRDGAKPIQLSTSELPARTLVEMERGDDLLARLLSIIPSLR